MPDGSSAATTLVPALDQWVSHYHLLVPEQAQSVSLIWWTAAIPSVVAIAAASDASDASASSTSSAAASASPSGRETASKQKVLTGLCYQIPNQVALGTKTGRGKR
jgi:hypothetical protein